MSHYYSEEQDSPLDLKLINISVNGQSFQLYTGNGVFSKDGLDFGSRLLIEKALLEPSCSVLDLGCGVGVVGISVKKLYPTINVSMSDINSRATMLARRNVKFQNMDIEVIDSDGFEKIKDKFDNILLNPPQTAGKEVCFNLIKGSYEHLKPNGTLQLVARHNKGGSTLGKYMQELFGNVIDIAKSGGFRIYLSSKRT